MEPRISIPCILAAALVLGCGTPPKSTLDGETDSLHDTSEEHDTATECTSDEECDDGEPCNGAETCSLGDCTAGTPLPAGSPCETGGVGGACVEDICVPLTCGDSSLDDGEECDDGNEVPDDGCESSCRFSCHETADCGDENVCTDDSCAEGGTGRLCAHEANSLPCDDGDECTDPDMCEEGECRPGPGVCGCVTDEDCTPFEDGDVCNGTLVCEGGTCVVDPATVVDCPETGTVCNLYSCNPETGLCVPERAPSGTTCESDSNVCTDDECDGLGACGHPATDCSDSNACTTDTCSTLSGCVHGAIEGCCNLPSDCDDSNECTIDGCSTSHVCTHTPRDCSDSDLCTYDRCDSTTGCYYVSVDCTDHNQCTTDSCAPTSGCSHVITTGPCDDGDPCTSPDSCSTLGACVPGPYLPIWYRDSDGDGFGDLSVTACGSVAPVGYVASSEDCCDSEARVNPDQTTYFCSSFTCAGSTTPSWDYNCGGADYERWPYQGECYYYYGTCYTYEGWVSSTIPACGVSASFVTGCTSGCVAITATRCQECI